MMKKSSSITLAAHAPVNRLLKISEVSELTALARATIYVRIKSGEFPLPVKLGGRSVAWRQSDVQAWIDGLDYSSTLDVLSA